MAIYGVLGDIHGNREALEAARAQIRTLERIFQEIQAAALLAAEGN